MDVKRYEAISFLQGLDIGEPVRLTTADGKTHTMSVMRRFMRGDGGGFGSQDYATVKVGFGWGRYSVDVNAVALENGTYKLERLTDARAAERAQS